MLLGPTSGAKISKSAHPPANNIVIGANGIPILSAGDIALATDGTVYRSQGGNVSAIDASGVQKWSASGSHIAVADDGTVYVADKQVTAYSPDGVAKWSMPVELSEIAIGHDGVLYATGIDAVHALNPDGSEKWAIPFPQQVGAPVISDDGTVYVAGAPAGVDALYAIRSGAIAWMFATEGAALAPVVGVDGTAYVGTNTGRVHAVDANGAAKWTVVVPHTPKFPGTLGADGTIYFATNGSVEAIGADGTLRWMVEFSAPPFFESPPVIGFGGVLFVVNTQGTLYAIGPLLPCHALMYWLR